jgi:hypothetical protein
MASAPPAGPRYRTRAAANRARAIRRAMLRIERRRDALAAQDLDLSRRHFALVRELAALREAQR